MSFSPSSFLPEVERRVNAELRRILARGAANRPKRLSQAMRYAALGPGKRLRPILALLAARAVDGQRGESKALPFACALELIHAYSLVHDDLPAMDDDELRRGRATVHVRFDEATAILVGDALLTEAFAVCSGAGKHRIPTGVGMDRVVRIVAEIALAAGADGMVAGQLVDLLNENRRNPSLETVQSIHRRKTGALFCAAVRIGGLAAGADPKALRALGRYGDAIGLAFQIVDDVLDETGSVQKTGKRAGGDREAGKATYPALIGLEASVERARRAQKDAERAVRPLGQAAEPLVALARHVVARAT